MRFSTPIYSVNVSTTLHSASVCADMDNEAISKVNLYSICDYRS